MTAGSVRRLNKVCAANLHAEKHVWHSRLMWTYALSIAAIVVVVQSSVVQQIVVDIPACSTEISVSPADTHQCGQETDTLQTYERCSGATYSRCCQHLHWLTGHKCHCLPDFDQRHRQHLEELARDCAGWQDSGKAKAKSRDVKLFVGVLTSGANNRARRAIRETWGSDSRIHKLLFFSAKPKTASASDALRDEAAVTGDIVVLSSVSESYFNITYQTLEVLRFGAVDDSATHILKVDDDSYVRIGPLLDRISEAHRHRLFLGFIENPGGGPHRDPKSQWYVQPDEWASERYPPWAHGAGYVISQDVVREIAAGGGLPASDQRLFKLEDIAVASWVESVGKVKSWQIQYDHDPRFNYMGCGNDDLVSHYVKPRNMLCMHSRGGQCCTTRSLIEPHVRGIMP